jgi:hypothetical protein
MKARIVLHTLMVGGVFAGAAYAAGPTNVPAGVHVVSEHWTLAGSPYRLQGQVYFDNMSTLTIDPGVLVVSVGPGYLPGGAVDPAHPAAGGSLAICRNSNIIINGTAANPVIMTSTNDVHTWTGTADNGTTYDPNQIPGNPKSGVWRVAANEWGNLTIMGNGYISSDGHGPNPFGNSPSPAGTNVAMMEGLSNGIATDLFGGGNDDDDSGTITYLSVRYGGKVIGLGNELNGLSMGGIGRGTTVHHVDIMNNVDDGIETWGGTVNYRYLNIWNIGDDSFDFDEGWRGKAQFGLSVVGYSLSVGIGSGTGDHNFEMDGAEDADWQPVSTNSIYNFTCIGQPGSTRGMTAWRDNDRTQFHNCVFMDCGGEVVKFDNIDSDGGHGYGFNGTLTWPQTWTTAYNAVPPTVNDPAPGLPNYRNDSQCSGFLAEITDSVFFRNQAANAYTEATARGVFNAVNNNIQVPGINIADAPIQALVRGAPVVTPGYTVFPVASLDPRPANEALRRVGVPCNPFFTPTNYRGGFVPNEQAWIHDWTASEAFGFTPAVGGTVMTSFCAAGVAGVNACPCGNPQVPAGALRGCNNSSNTGGAQLSAVGTSSISNDTLVFTSAFEKPTANTIFMQGNATVTFGLTFGQGQRCVGGSLKRLYKNHFAVGGVVSAPVGADLPVTVQSALQGDTILPGQVRYYMAYYRDATVLGGCPSSSTFNGTQAGAVTWEP